MSKKAAILCVGTEITTGKNLDTNSQYLARKLFLLGIDVSVILNLPDHYSVLKKHLSTAIKENDIIILTGGLGPTQDDITRDVVKDVLDLKTVYSADIYNRIEKRFKRRGYATPEINKSQALVFKNSIILNNSVGTAPGFIIEKKKKAIVLLPGPPPELVPMVEKFVIPYIHKKFKMNFFHKVFRIAGLPESYIAEKLKELDSAVKELKGDLTYLCTPNLIDVIISSKYNIEKIKKLSVKVKQIFFNNIYADKWENIYNIVSNLLLRKRLSISIAESCTGGLVGKTITDIPGSSRYFKFGIVCYSNESKIKLLKVKREALQEYGAVSEQTAMEILKGLNRIIKTDISVSITGIAGPSGGSKNKPVGMVYIGVRFKNNTEVHRFVFNGNRERIRYFTLNKVFELLYQRLKR